jgi:hypothetical protein
MLIKDLFSEHMNEGRGVSRFSIHSIGMCSMWQFLVVLRSLFHSTLLCTFSCNTYPPTVLPSSLTEFCHLFLVYLSTLFFQNSFIILFWEVYFSSILCTCLNHCNCKSKPHNKILSGEMFWLLWFFPVSFISSAPHNHLHLDTAVIRKKVGKSWETSNKEMLDLISENTSQKSTFT